jgi:hypothetical protein
MSQELKDVDGNSVVETIFPITSFNSYDIAASRGN